METNVRTPQEVFYLPQHLVVPLFQRPYVWEEPDQWLPLWEDVVRMAELRLKDPYTQVRHFLGAVVLQANDVSTGTIPTRNVIDGQQRLTTLQLLADAAAAVLEERELDSLAQQLDDLTHNRAYVGDSGPTLKLRHTNQDGSAFTEVMGAEPPVKHDSLMHAASRITRAHAFFVKRVAQWLRGEAGSVEPRARALTYVISQGIQLVVIDLQAQENSQEIFETLNARGTPLTAADLIKNFVFQRLDAEGADTKRAYAEDWPFENAFWDSDVSVGRYTMSRGSLFLGQWLGSRLGEEVSPRQTFIRFKAYVDYESGVKMSELLVEIKAQAEGYRLWAENAADRSRILTVPEMTFYRMGAGGIELLKPLMIWLYEPGLKIPQETADEVINMLESWVVRRQLLRLTSADLGRVVADIMRANRFVPAQELTGRVRAHLTRLNVASTYWPGNTEIRSHLLTEQAYRRYSRGRLRMYLEAIEDRLRAAHKYPQVARLGYPIEHVMPQKWTTHWGVPGLEAELARSEHVHRLGNLTLLTTSLNSAVSNGPWSGQEGKRAQIRKHDVLLINRHFAELATWGDADIDNRTAALVEIILQIWPVPQGHKGEISDPPTKETAGVELKHLVAAGFLPPGTRIRPRAGEWGTVIGTVTADGQIEVDGKHYATLSNAGYHVKGGRATNGWTFWHLEDGHALSDLRARYRETLGDTSSGLDWSRLHELLEALPEGAWTSYSELADAVGTAPQALEGHTAHCPRCANAWRILAPDGHIAPGFARSDSGDTRVLEDMLRAEGVRMIDGAADPIQQLDSEALSSLLRDEV